MGESYLFGCQIVTPVTVGDTLLTDTLSTTLGCDSIVKLTLTVLALDPLDTTIVDTVCYGSDYVHRLGTMYNLVKDTAFNDTVFNAVKITETYYRDSVYRYEIAVLPEAKDSVASITICEKDSFLWYGQMINKTDTYYATDKYARFDCDSVNYTLNAIVNKASYSEKKDTITIGDSYILPSLRVVTPTYPGDTLVRDTLVNAVLCDSIVTINLFVKDTCKHYSAIEAALICEDQLFYEWRGQFIMTAGLHYDTVHLASGCDSIYQLSLTIVTPIVHDIENATFCESDGYYEWKNHFILSEQIGATNDTTVVDTVKDQSCGCAIEISKLYLQMFRTPTDTIVTDSTICAGDVVVWYGKNYVKTGTYRDTVRNAAGCDEKYVKLNLVVRDFIVMPTEYDTICANQPLTWHGQVLTKTGVYFDTIRYASAPMCDSAAYMLALTVNEIDSITIFDNMCLAEAQSTYPQFHVTGTGIYKYVTSSLVTGCDSITMLNIIVKADPDKIIVSDLEHKPIVACGMPIDVTASTIEVAAIFASREDETIAVVDTFWFEAKYPGETTFKPISEKDTIKSYLEDQPIKIRLAFTTECDTTIRGMAVDFYVQKPSPEVLPGYDNLPAVSKYNNWLLMINYKAITAMGYTFTEDDVTWYKVVGEIDPAGARVDDDSLATGFYYTEDKALVGDYYAVIDAHASFLPCGAFLRTVILHCATAPSSQMRLVPNAIRQGETMELININPEAETKVFMYDHDGKLVGTTESEGADRLYVQPKHGVGVYLLRVSNGENEQTFKYVITK